MGAYLWTAKNLSPWQISTIELKLLENGFMNWHQHQKRPSQLIPIELEG